MINGASHSGRLDEGFTLLEALVATTLVALLATVLFGAVSVGTRVMEGGIRRADIVKDIAIVRNFLGNHLAQARPSWRAEEKAPRAPMFDGRTQGLAFIELAPELPPLGAKRMVVRTERARDGLRLVAFWESVRDIQAGLASSTIAVHTTVLLERVASVEFAYFGSDDPSHAPTWRPEWPMHASLPALVRLRVRFAKDDARQDFFVALRLAERQPLLSAVNG